jgi:hypothetical protein
MGLNSHHPGCCVIMDHPASKLLQEPDGNVS